MVGRSVALSLPLVAALAAVTSAQTPETATSRVSVELISRADALKIADAAVQACERQGETVAAFVTDADGYLRAALSSDGLNPVGFDTASRKTTSVLQFKMSTRALQERLKSEPTFAAQYGSDARYFFHPGGVPMYRSGKFVAVIAVGGGHDKDESCALEALRLLSWARPTA